ncbi:MAG: ABC transporter ATP-binding protein [Devosia sp.]
MAAAATSAQISTAGDKIVVDNLEVRYGLVTAVNGVSFTIRRGEHLTLLGPSGCGKTTTLRAIAGLESPTGGAILIDDTPIYSAARRVNVPAERRGVSMVFQSYAIWPHMTVFENVAYGLRVRKRSKQDIEKNVERALALVHMTQYAKRPSGDLSGGQQQRVALARAIAFDPEVILFDEPLSNLDAKLRVEMRVELRELQQHLGITSIYVTHDQEEALAISDRVVVMRNGEIEQLGTPDEIYNRPRTRFVADFVGAANLLDGEVGGSGNDITFTTQGLSLKAFAPHGISARNSTAAIRTAYVEFAPIGSAPRHANIVKGRVRQKMFHGDFIQYLIDWPAGTLIVRRPPTEVFDEGTEILVCFDAVHCIVLSS